MVEPHLLSAEDRNRLVFGAMVTDTANVMQIGAASSRSDLSWACTPDEPVVTPEDFPQAPLWLARSPD
ncbi:MAG: hypothetical protein LC798_16635 [Chloroflexi bacterium]|nr:hypothetical protein [Chloroflexota bacterium]